MQDLSKIAKIFRGNLNRLMGEKGVSQKELADYMGVTSATASRWLSGQKLPRFSKLEKMGKFFGVTQTDLISEEGLYDNPSVSDSEFKTITNFRELTPENQQIVDKIVTAFLSQQMLTKVSGFVNNNLSKPDGETLTDEKVPSK